MELGEYPFSQCFGWLIDQFGVSWQIDYFEGKAISQRVIPTLLFSGEQCGKGKDAISLYTSTFPDSKLQKVLSYGEDEEPNHANTIKRAEFTLNGQSFALLEREHPQPFTFNEAISFLVLCETQEEIDQIWEKLSAFPEAEACGWLKDPFGVSWQLVPALLYELEQGNETNRVARVHQALLQMKKLNISQLQSAYFS